MAVKPSLPSGKGQANVGQLNNYAKEKYAEPFEAVDNGVSGMGSIKNDIGEKSGFDADSSAYLVKKGMVYGEAAKLNIMPPGMDIADQPYADIRDMALVEYQGGVNFPGDGAFPVSSKGGNSSSSGHVPGA
jgi:hypothetical protein